MIFIAYSGIQGLGLLLIMFSSTVLHDKPSFADQPDEGTWFCDIDCCSIPTGKTNFLFSGNQHEWTLETDIFWALFIYPRGI